MVYLGPDPKDQGNRIEMEASVIKLALGMGDRCSTLLEPSEKT